MSKVAIEKEKLMQYFSELYDLDMRHLAGEIDRRELLLARIQIRKRIFPGLFDRDPDADRILCGAANYISCFTGIDGY